MVVLAWNKRALQEVGISEIGSFVGEGAGGPDGGHIAQDYNTHWVPLQGHLIGITCNK